MGRATKARRNTDAEDDKQNWQSCAIQPYSSLVNCDGPTDDCHIVDDEFFIYFPRTGTDHDQDYLYCRKINID